MRAVSTATITAATALLATAAIGAGITQASAGSAGSAARACATWNIVPEPAALGSDQLSYEPLPGASDVIFAPDTGLFSQSVLGSEDAWFFGLDGYSTGPQILHWNGRRVSPAATHFPRGGFFPGSSGSASFDSDKDGWVLGSGLPDVEASVSGTAERWHDGRWTMVPLAVSPQPAREDASVGAIAALSPADAWAVGGVSDARSIPGLAPNGALIEHWGGTRWSVVLNPASSRKFAVLNSIAAVSARDIWAVGFQSNDHNGIAPLVEHFDGTRWAVIPVPLPAGDSQAVLVGVTATSGTDVWAGGAQARSGRVTALAEHWNGAAWRAQKLPPLPPLRLRPAKIAADFGLDALYAASPADVWGALRYPDNVPVFLHWDGRKWSSVRLPGPQEFGLRYTYNSIAGTGPGNVWADGYVLNQVYGTVTPQIAHLGCRS